MYTPLPHGKPDLDEVGCFMFFAWPILLVIGILQAFFWLIGWLFEHPKALLFVVIVAAVAGFVLTTE